MVTLHSMALLHFYSYTDYDKTFNEPGGARAALKNDSYHIRFVADQYNQQVLMNLRPLHNPKRHHVDKLNCRLRFLIAPYNQHYCL